MYFFLNNIEFEFIHTLYIVIDQDNMAPQHWISITNSDGQMEIKYSANLKKN